MPDEADFLCALAANPRDRGLRLQYADWLLDHRDPLRAELVQVCEAMRGVPVWSDDYWALKARRNELWEQVPLEWLEATGYDGGDYDPVFRSGVPDGVQERWRLLREFTERWHGVPLPDAGGRHTEVHETEERLGRTLPPSLREFIAYVHDLAAASPRHDPRLYNTIFHCASFLLFPLQRHAAVSLIHFTLDCSILGIADDDLAHPDPPTTFFDEVLEADGSYVPPRDPRPLEPPHVMEPRLSLSVFKDLFLQLPTAGGSEARGIDPDEWLPRLAADFPIHARFDHADVFERDEVLVLVRPLGEPACGPGHYFAETIVRRPIPLDSVPRYLRGGPPNMGSSGMLMPEIARRQLSAEERFRFESPSRPGPPDLGTYAGWLRDAGRPLAWVSGLRQRDLDRRLAETTGRGEPPISPPPAPDFPSDDGMPF